MRNTDIAKEFPFATYNKHEKCQKENDEIYFSKTKEFKQKRRRKRRRDAL